MIWLVFTLILATVLAIMLWPLLTLRHAGPARIDYDLAVYRDQLAEVERDHRRGLLDESQLAGARTEIQRRMLAAEDGSVFVAHGEVVAETSRRRWSVALVLAAFLSLGGGALYLWLGHPGLPGQPFAARQSDPAFEAQGMIAHIETEMRAAPSARGYRMLGDLYSKQSRYEEAAAAYRQSVSRGGSDAELYSLLAEAEVMANDGSVVPEARADFLSALRLDRTDARARFYLGLAESEIGDYAKAVAIWRDLEKDSPADAPWLSMLREHITAFAKQGGFDPATVAPAPPAIPAAASAMPAGPAAAQSGMPTGPAAAAIAGAAPEDRDRMIRSMVAGLADKMENDPGNLDGWLRLARAYKVLGEKDKSDAARSHAASLIAAMPAGDQRNEAQEQLDSLQN